MKLHRILPLLLWFILLPLLGGCDAEKQATQRRNLMIPQKSELPRNSKYSGSKKKKTYKPKKAKNKKSKKR